MCGRMTLTRSGAEIADYFALLGAEEAAMASDGTPRQPRFNIAPSQFVPSIRVDDEGVRLLEWRTWGLLPSWATDRAMAARLFNARSETAATKPSFRAAFKKRRCLIPTDGFYEWTPRNKDHQPYFFSPRQGSVLGFAGLYESWLGEGAEVIESCTVLTTEANADLADVHHRMPVLIPPDRFSSWLDPATERETLEELLAPAPANTLDRRPVARNVNDARRDDPSCWADPEPAAQGDLF